MLGHLFLNNQQRGYMDRLGGKPATNVATNARQYTE